MTIRTFLVDDHALVRTGIRMILSGAVDIDIIGEAESGEQALPQIRELKPDVVVCDMHLPGISGLEVTERIMKGEYGARVVIVSVLEDGPIPKRVLARSEEHTSELQSLMRISYAVFCLQKKKYQYPVYIDSHDVNLHNFTQHSPKTCIQIYAHQLNQNTNR